MMQCLMYGAKRRVNAALYEQPAALSPGAAKETTYGSRRGLASRRYFSSGSPGRVSFPLTGNNGRRSARAVSLQKGRRCEGRRPSNLQAFRWRCSLSL
jgi:hypothetical protein